MKKRIGSLLLSLALCLSMTPTAAFAEGAQPEEPLPQEQTEQAEPTTNDPGRSEQDEDVVAVQALIDALPDASELDELDEAAQENACLAASEAYDAYDALTEEQQSALTDADNMIAILEWATRPVAPMADGTGEESGTAASTKPECGDSHDGWKAWDSTANTNYQTTLPNEAGKYYLTENVTLSATWQPVDGTVLCLNGHRITCAGNENAIAVESGRTFTLTDCNGSEDGNGKITHESGTGRGVHVIGTFNMYGGSISGNTFSGVYVPSGGTFHMYGGSITGNTANYGGGVCLRSGTFNMDGGSITDNSANINGGGVYVYSGSFIMTGGSITGNNVSGSDGSGGVYVGDKFTVSGNVNITGNSKNGNVNNVYLPSYKSITIGSGGLTTGAEIGVTTEKSPTNNVPLTIVRFNAKKGDEQYIKSDTGHYPAYMNGGIFLYKSQPHIHPLCGETCADGYNHAAVYWNPISSADALLQTSSNSYYYLTDNITLTSTWTPANGVKLCLNGYSITCKQNVDAIAVDENVTFTLTNCKGSGKITHQYTDQEKYVRTADGCGAYVNGGTFYLYGGSISKNTGHNSAGGGVYVEKSGTFNMYGGSIIGNSAGNTNDNTYGGGVYLNGGTFHMSGGSITGNSSGICGGVYVYSGSFIMSGGSITGNSAKSQGGGVHVRLSGTFHMSGGSIIGNNVINNSGGGVNLASGSFTVSGSASITGNVKGGSKSSDSSVYTGGTANNVGLNVSSTITIGDSGLDGAARIGVANEPTVGNPIKIATGATGDVDYTQIFTPDVSGKNYEVTKDESGNLYLFAHQHKWNYSLDTSNKTITATCAGCPLNGGKEYSGGSVTISAPADLTYDGTAKAAKVTASEDWQGDSADKITISYSQEMPEGSPKPLDSAPIAAGDYIASITMGTGDDAVTASVMFTIKKADQDAPDGLAKVSVTDTSITVTENDKWQYSIDDGKTWQDSNEFTGLTRNTEYTIIARLKADANHNAGNASAALSVTTSRSEASDELKEQLKKALTPYRGTYDASEHNVFAVGALAEGWSSEYSKQKDGTYSTVIPKVMNVSDSKTVYVKFSNADYNDFIAEYQVSVTPADISKAEIALGIQDIYDGKSHNAMIDSVKVGAMTLNTNDYDISVNSATNVESKELTITGKGNFTGEAKKAWSLRKADPTADYFHIITPAAVTYSGKDVTVAAPELKSGLSGVGAITVKYDGSKTAPVDAGSYTVTFDVLEGTNYNVAEGLSIGTLVINKAEPKSPAGLTGTIGQKLSSVKLPEEWSWKAPDTVMEEKGDKSFEAKYAGSKNYNAKENVSLTVKVNEKAAVNITISGMPDTVAYGDKFTLTPSQTGDTAADEKWSWDLDRDYFKLIESNANTGMIKLQAIKAGTPGKDVTINYESDTHKGSGSVTVSEIAKKILTKDDLNGIPDKLTKVYDGGTGYTYPDSTAIALTLKDSVQVLDSDRNMQIGISADQITFAQSDAGTTTAKITLNELPDQWNYKFADDLKTIDVPAAITPKAITIASATATNRVYTNGNKNVDVSVIFNGLVGSETLTKDTDYTAAGLMDNDTAGENKNVAVTVTLKNGNYSLLKPEAATTVNISKSSAPALSAAPITQRWNDTAEKAIDVLWTGIPADTGNKTFSATVKSVPDGISMGKWSMDPATGKLTYALTGATAAHAGQKIVLNVKLSSENYNDTAAEVEIQLIARNSQTISFAESTIAKTYGDDDFTVKASGAATAVAYASSDTSVATVDDNGNVHILKAGKATITATASETADYDGASAKYELTVNKKSVEAPAADKTQFVYNGADQTYKLAASDDYTINGNVKKDAGSYKVTVNLKDKNNLQWSDKTTEAKEYDFVISKQIIEAPAEGINEFVYNGADQTYELAANNAYTISDNVQKTVGDYEATVKLKDKENTQWKDGSADDKKYSFTIKKLIVTVPEEDTTVYTYDGTEKTYKLAENAAYTISDNNKQTAANENGYTVTVTLNDPANTQWSDNTNGEKSYTFVIHKKSVEAPAADDTKFVYDGTEKTYKLTANDAYNITGNTQQKAGSYKVKVDLKDKKNVQWSDKTTEAKEYDFVIDKQTVNVPEEDKTNFVYTGKEQTYGLKENAAYTITGNKQTAANEDGHIVTVSLNNKENTQWSDGGDADKTFKFVIKKAAVTVTVNDKSAYTGDKVPDLSKPEQDKDYTVSGLIGTDALTTAPTLAYDPAEPDMSKAGEADIKASGADAGSNYTITYVDGKLTVTNRRSSGGGSSAPTYTVTSPTKTENGTVTANVKNAKQGDKVTITVTPEKDKKLDSLTVTDKDGKKLELTDLGNGKYTFVMPAGNVTIASNFIEEAPTVPVEKNDQFIDVKSGDYFYDAVTWAVEKGITSGVSATTFAPNAPCTRAQIVTFLWRAAGSPEPKSASSFSDVSADSYYAKAVAWAVENGITGGTGNGKFSPDETCTREQAAAFLYRASGSPEVSGGSAFSDVADNAYYAKAVAWAEKNGITGGVGGGRFGSGNDCTRGQIVTFLYRSYMNK